MDDVYSNENTTCPMMVVSCDNDSSQTWIITI